MAKRRETNPEVTGKNQRMGGLVGPRRTKNMVWKILDSGEQDKKSGTR